jgi:proliferating cell nuclear antigen PCNA
MLIQLKNSNNANILAIIFQNMKLFSDNVNISFTEEQMHIQCMDSGHVSIMELYIGNDWFDVYRMSETAPNLTIGVNSNILSKILGTREKMQDIEIECDDEPDNLTIRYSSDDKSVFDKTFTIPLIDLDVEIMEIPEIEYEAEFSLPSATYASLMAQLKLFGDTMDIDCSEETIMIHSTSIEAGTMTTEIGIDELNEFAIDEGEELKLSFSLNHLYNVAQFHKLSQEIELKFKQNYPAQLIYNLGGENATLRFYIAPKISDEE